MFNKAIAYASELWFCMRRVKGVGGRFRLAAKTLAFHWHNWTRREIKHDKPFSVEVRMKHGTRPLKLRTYAGDVQILYRTLMGQIDHLPDSLCPPAEVKTIVDCGANVGIASLYLADRYPNARIFSIEPHPENFELLRANTAGEPRITPINACIAGSEGTPRFMTVDRPAWGNQINQSGIGVAIAVTTIESVCRDYNLSFIDLLKIDIEGAEEELFAEPKFLDKVGLILIELHGDYDLDRFRGDVSKFQWTVRPPDPKLRSVELPLGRRKKEGSRSVRHNDWSIK